MKDMGIKWGKIFIEEVAEEVLPDLLLSLPHNEIKMKLASARLATECTENEIPFEGDSQISLSIELAFQSLKAEKEVA
jgi:hypothetical protein